MNNNIDFDSLIQVMGKTCYTTEVCGSCEGKECLVGYCKDSLVGCIKNKDEFIEDGMDDIPINDVKIYDEQRIVNTIAFTLKQCKNCQMYHDEECIINIIRSSMEIALMGDYIDYQGSTLMYFSDLANKDSEVQEKIFSRFNNKE
ncbi:hypothetical protein EDC19_1581 [Natranaerovirga hydrolytica]|uniref:Uncharacterized protein n=1 Tax=Natranaerovirga hydrolytica TaxID=680378 RepID=A0A4R1MKM6_9FIRM|nr:hypothetical protein [Natranaerovirga hydrolytica]TCK93388.1 hypothetical protein EDC19_1581 [Natranaerovirga hydrolytica]